MRIEDKDVYEIIEKRLNLAESQIDALFEKNKFKKLRGYYRGLRDYKKGIKGKCPYKN